MQLEEGCSSTQNVQAQGGEGGQPYSGTERGNLAPRVRPLSTLNLIVPSHLSPIPKLAQLQLLMLDTLRIYRHNRRLQHLCGSALYDKYS